jgi:SAM-dependent methyltransferase
VLDFGCGVGRILRQAVADSPSTEFWGCDIDAPSVHWLEGHLSGRAHVLRAPDAPPLPLPDRHFDLIYAFSVFTHLVDSWSAWLLELRRVLADDGTLIITVAGPGRSNFVGEPVSEEIIGMNVFTPSASWDVGGPLVMHSEWWLRAHWGRAFEILELRPSDEAGPPPLYGQGLVVMRKRPGPLSTADLEAIEPNEPREFAALKQNVMSLRREIARHSAVYDTRSWRLTAPLRSASGLIRSRLAQRRTG